MSDNMIFLPCLRLMSSISSSAVHGSILLGGLEVAHTQAQLLLSLSSNQCFLAVQHCRYFCVLQIANRLQQLADTQVHLFPLSPSSRHWPLALQIADRQQQVADALVHLLRTCPDTVSLRKEMLVATRHMLSASFRRWGS